MKNISKVSIIIAALMAFYSGFAISFATEISPLITVPGIFLFAFITAPEGVLMWTLAHVTKTTDDKIGGTANYILVADVSDFTTIKGLKTTTNPGDTVTIDGSHVFAANKGFAKIYITPNTGILKLGNIGARDKRSKKPVYEGEMPGTDPIAIEAARHLKNRDVIVLVPLASLPAGSYAQVGSEDFPAELSDDYDSTVVEGDGARTKLMVEAAGAQSLVVYEGTVTLI